MLNVPTSLTAKPPIGRSEYGRVKIALPPGKGLMDWVRLSSGKALAKKRLPSVDHEELKKHNTAKDCWIHIFGQVYDVTEYLDFHPGGVPELMRAAGRDGTNLFNQYHAWVNYESMLKSCLVGRFVGDLSKLSPCGPPTVDETSTSIVAQIKNNTAKLQDSHGIRVRTSDNSITISHDDWVSLEVEHVSVNMHEKLLRVLIRHPRQPSIEIKWVDLKMTLNTSCEVVVDCDNRIKIQFLVDNDRITGNLGTFVVRKRPIVDYHQFSIIEKERITRDTLLFHIQSCSGQQIRLPFGHHLSMKIRKGASTIYRPYTPIESYVENNCTFMKLMIKIYSDGICTPTIAMLDQGDKLELSDPIGDFDISTVKPMDDLIMLAAGTGITPMLPILNMRISEDSRGNNLVLLYNKTEDDIPSIVSKFGFESSTVENILSTPSEFWNGRKGRITAAHLPALDRNSKVLICGPDGFLSSANRLLEDFGIPTTNIHIFQG